MTGIFGKAMLATGACLLVASPVLAGEKFAPPPGDFDPLPPKQTSLPKSKQHDWTGFYAGVQSGAAFGNAGVKSSNESARSPILGAHAGYNYQFGRGLVLGGESDVSK